MICGRQPCSGVSPVRALALFGHFRAGRRQPPGFALIEEVADGQSNEDQNEEPGG